MEKVILGITITHQGMTVSFSFGMTDIKHGTTIIQLFFERLHYIERSLATYTLYARLITEIFYQGIRLPRCRTAVWLTIFRSHRLAKIRHQLRDSVDLLPRSPRSVFVQHVIPVVGMYRKILVNLLAC